MTDSKSSNPSNEVDSQQYRGNQSDEHHEYDEVQHELKEKQDRSSVKVLTLVNDHAKGSTQELFDDVMYSPCPPKSAQHPDADITRNQHSGKGMALPQKTSTKLTGKWSERKTPETVATKEQLNRSEEHVYDSVDQTSQGPTKPQVIPPHSDSTSGGSNKNQHEYHTLESQESSQDKEVDSKSHTLAANSKFDDPMYESTLIQAQANPQGVATPSAYPMMDSGETEPQENGNPDLVPNYDGNVKDSTAAPQHSDPTNSEPMGTATVQKVLDEQDKGPINSTSDYDVFDDPTYGNCVPHAGADRKIIRQ